MVTIFYLQKRKAREKHEKNTRKVRDPAPLHVSVLVSLMQVVDLEDVAVADIAAGGWHSMALTADGQIYVWGR